MLQLATILSMVKPWKTYSTLRVYFCIDAINENAFRVQTYLNELLSQLRINAQTRIIAWENVLRLINNPSTTTDTAATIPVDRQLTTNRTTTASTNEFVDINDEYIHGMNELIRQQCDNTSCVYLYLPRPPRDRTLSPRYIQILDMISNDLPPTMFVHGVSSVTCTRL